MFYRILSKIRYWPISSTRAVQQQAIHQAVTGPEDDAVPRGTDAVEKEKRQKMQSSSNTFQVLADINPLADFGCVSIQWQKMTRTFVLGCEFPIISLQYHDVLIDIVMIW